ncbi:hypothetical protein [Corynebacterium sp. CNCTC7651]|uniref:hypothetical protein n=1 Tax=Corynebacterium sp. CNCTC7651 TaxID=2815361 RepID=UPI00351CBBD9
MDYEWAGFRDATFDVAFVVAGFPLYISPQHFNEDAVHAFIDAWLAEVADTWPLLKHEDTLQARITGSLIGWALSSLSVLNPVALAEVVAGDEELAAEFERAGIDFEEDIEEVDAPATGDVLRPGNQGPFTAAERMVREDLHETFRALASYAGTGRDPAYLVIADFADRVATRLR